MVSSRVFAAAVLGVVLMLLPTAGALRAQASDATAGLQWLAGCWKLERGDRTTLETWMVPAGGLMIGGSRTVAGGRTREFEHLRIAARSDGIVYVAMPSGQQPTEFAGTVTDSGFVVENPAHDFPKKIIYRRRGADSVVARIEGPGRDGQTRGIDFPYRRTSCLEP